MAYRILHNTRLNPSVCRLEIEARDIAEKALPGQFVMVRVDEPGERIPLTVFDCHAQRGTIELIVQEAGTSTGKLCALKPPEAVLDMLGPLGIPTEIKRYGTVLCVGGGVGIAEIYPVAAALQKAGNRVLSIIGARNKELLILEAEMRRLSSELLVTTDDGSSGRKGLVTDAIQTILAKETVAAVFAVGPVPMMKNVADFTRPLHLKTIISLNSIMVDGTGMCGSCRITVGGKVKFVCVDGPDFDAHEVDFKELTLRQGRFFAQENQSREQYKGNHTRCHAVRSDK
jgi:ferredoxin--NADP+ reductase